MLHALRHERKRWRRGRELGVGRTGSLDEKYREVEDRLLSHSVCDRRYILSVLPEEYRKESNTSMPTLREYCLCKIPSSYAINENHAEENFGKAYWSECIDVIEAMLCKNDAWNTCGTLR